MMTLSIEIVNIPAKSSTFRADLKFCLRFKEYAAHRMLLNTRDGNFISGGTFRERSLPSSVALDGDNGHSGRREKSFKDRDL